ncbi:SUMF1/EgtB/PvdO family nonheme iron enzyme, partial [bacterium]|nr:SUMF1/EgtB/PvdO family nonheme iron enzyme [bacterium]
MSEPVKKKFCFVIMPFGKLKTPEHRKNWNIYQLIKKIANEFGYLVHRADESDDIGNITREIMEKLLAADLVIADLSFWNVNVFYELGVRHVLKRKGTIPVYRMVEDPPFDIRNYRAIPFLMDSEEDQTDFQNQLRSKIQYFEQGISKTADNPVHEFIGDKIIQPGDLRDYVLKTDYEKAAEHIQILEKEKSKLEHQLTQNTQNTKKYKAELARLKSELATAIAKAKSQPSKVNNSILPPNFVRFKGGHYTVQKTGKTENIKSYEMAIYPVTNHEYEQFDSKHERNEYSDQDDQPVNNVNWDEANAYCDWIGKKIGQKYRLPTEAEWEFAASGGGKRKYPWGNPEPTPERANYEKTGLNK